MFTRKAWLSTQNWIRYSCLLPGLSVLGEKTPFSSQSIACSRYGYSTTNKSRNYRYQTISSNIDSLLLQVNPHKYTTEELCSLLKSRDVSIPDIDNICLAISGRRDITPEQVEIAARGLFRVNYYKQLIHFVRVIVARFPGFHFTVHTCEMIMESVLHSKQYDLLDLMWELCDRDVREHWSVLGPYCHCLLAARRIGDSRPYLDRLQREQYSISAANCHVLQGLYSGHYYAECLHFFKGLVSLDHSGQLLGNPTSVHTALKAAYQLKEFKTVLEIFDLMQKRDMRMVRPVVFMVAEVYEKGDFWRMDYERKIGILRENGIIPTEKQQLQLLAQARLPQYIRGSEILESFSRLKNESQLVVNENGDYYVSLEKYHDPQRRLRLFGVLDSIGSNQNPKDSKTPKRLIVNTIDGDPVLRRLLSMELYPSVHFTQQKYHIKIPVKSIRNWKMHRNDTVL